MKTRNYKLHNISLINFLCLLNVIICFLFFSNSSFAALNQNCTVSVLNRTAQVKADGTWIIPNVPSNMGKVRVRATCVENGVTRSGQSDWVSIPTNGTIKVGDISLDVFEPVPTSLNMVSPETTLNGIGTTAQLAVTATYPGGTTRDITQGSSGTVYGSTNPNIATVSDNGLVTATGTGRVIISASSEMVLSSLLFTVTQSSNPDADNDGIPDEWELANGLNPNNSVDAFEDFDHDGLINLDEYLNGTAMRNADTDGDGIQDGEELAAGRDGYITNPLLADSDGDGIKDGLEVQTGSDPTNAGNYNLSRTLARLEVTPSNLVLVFNTIMTETSRQLTVTGVLTDGTRIDLTSNIRGTNYISSDLAVASFGGEDGRVFAGQNGVAVITASNNGFSTAARVTVRTFSPTALSYVNIPGFANNVDVAGNYAYVSAGSAGLQVVDISNPSSPYIVSSLDTPGNANDIKAAGSYVYIADGQYGLRIIDISNPLVPLFAGTADTPGTAWDVAISGNFAYIADGSAGLIIIDISNPLNPVIIGSVDTPGTAKGVDISGNYAVIADSSSVKIINVSTPANPLIVGTAGISGDAMDVITDGNIAYIASYTGGLRTIDFTNPANPVTTSTVGDNYLFDIARFGNFAFGADVVRVNASPIYNLSNPLSPAFTAILDFSRFSDYDGTGIAAAKNYLYLTASKGIIENGTTGNTRLFIGQYADLIDTGNIPPTVTITSPANNAEVIEGSILPITVSATDDVLTASVNLLIDGNVVATDNAAPFQFNYQVPMGITSLAVGATAIDLANNIGSSENIFLSVIPTQPPSVSITSHTNGESVLEGTFITISASASDDVGVSSLEFMVNGTVISTDTTSPYNAIYQVPVGTTNLILGARAIDGAGKTGYSGDIEVNVTPNKPPVVTVTSPAAGSTLIEGSIITITANASDDIDVISVEFIINGTAIGTDTTSPYQLSYTIPSGITVLTIGAVAKDTIGKLGTATDVTINVIADPDTTVIGRVVDANQQPVAGATVTALSTFTGTTGPDGSFTISNVPTIQGNIAVAATVEINGVSIRGSSSSYSPVPFGNTDVGTVILFSAVSLAETGQTTCYNHSGSAIACEGTGQDGEIKAGVEWPNPRFTVGTGIEADCVTDNLTGLMWTKNANPYGHQNDWQGAIDFANNLNLCGYTDWRMPNIKELMRLMSFAKYRPYSWLSTQGFSNVSFGCYWSSTSIVYSPNSAWIVCMWFGDMTGDGKHRYGYVWPVRSGQ